MSSRRNFLLQSAAAVAAVALPKWSAATRQPDNYDLQLSNAKSIMGLDSNIVYLNNGTMGPSPKPVVDAMLDGLQDVTQRGLYGRRKQEAIDSLAAYFGVAADTIGITHSTTEGINMMAQGLKLKAGDEVIITDQEHVGNAAPWLYRAQQSKLVIRSFSLGNTAEQTLAAIKKLITAKTKVIAVPHITCTNGQVLPIKAICALAKAKNITTCIDGAHTAGMLDVNLADLGCDFYAGCCHKWLLAAQGTGYFYARPGSVGKIKQVFLGAEGIKEFETSKGTGTLTMREVTGHNFMLGTQSGALLSSVTAATQLFQNYGKANVEQYVKGLTQYFYEGLKAIGNDIQILTPEEKQSRAAITSFRFKKADTKKLWTELQNDGIITRYVPESNLNAIRVSTHIYNTEQQLNDLLKRIRAFK
ncbi:MAG: hypothetical protein RL660_885 [Bacteroidota bacterium]|jgi:selenocysteine lyase/cysteine desulfurase